MSHENPFDHKDPKSTRLSKFSKNAKKAGRVLLTLTALTGAVEGTKKVIEYADQTAKTSAIESEKVHEVKAKINSIFQHKSGGGMLLYPLGPGNQNYPIFKGSSTDNIWVIRFNLFDSTEEFYVSEAEAKNFKAGEEVNVEYKNQKIDMGLYYAPIRIVGIHHLEQGR